MSQSLESPRAAVQMREDAQNAVPLLALTHEEQIAEYVRLVEEARMRT